MKSIILLLLFFISTNIVFLGDVFIEDAFADNEKNGFFSNKNLNSNSFFESKENKNKDTKTSSNFNDKKVITISAILNAHKEKEVNKNLEDFYDFCIKRKIQPKAIYLKIPPYKSGLDKILAKFLLLGTDISYSVPDGFKRIQYSPSYIIFTAKGYYVLDGFTSLSKTVTTSGIFVEPR